MKKVISFLFSLIFLVSCAKKDTQYEIDPVLDLLSLTKDSDGVTLSWKPLKVQNFINFQIIRLSSNYPLSFNKPEEIMNNGEVIAIIKDPSTTKFNDRNLTYGNCFYYILKVNFQNDRETQTFVISSNFLSYENNELIFNINSGNYNEDGTKINLTWGKITNPNFKRYEIYRLESSYAMHTSSDVIKNGTLISLINPNDQAIYTDDEVNSSNSYIIYAIKAITKDNMSYSQNVVAIKNNLVFDFIPEYVLIAPNEKHMILLDAETKTIVQYDLDTRRIVNSIVLDNQCFRPFIGEFNNKHEIYIPTSKGRILIFDCQTFNKILEINLNTTDYITSVIKKGDLLFYLRSNGLYDYSSAYGYALSRSTLTEVPIDNPESHSTYYYSGSNDNFFDLKDNYFLAVSLRTGVNNLVKYTVANNLVSLSVKGIYSVSSNYNSFGISANSDFFVFDAYHRKINYDVFSNSSISDCFTYLGTYGATHGNYSDVCITNGEVYFGVLNKNIINVYNREAFNSLPKRTIETSYPPLFLRKTNKGLYSLNKMNYSTVIQFYPYE